VTTLRIFGSKCFVYNNKRESKASQRGEIGIFLGYSGNAQYYVEILETGALKRVDAAQVLIDESVLGGTLLTSSTKGPSLLVRVGGEIEAPQALSNCNQQGASQALSNYSQQRAGTSAPTDCSRQGPLTSATDRSRQGPLTSAPQDDINK
jgi:hypothetical protein